MKKKDSRPAGGVHMTYLIASDIPLSHLPAAQMGQRPNIQRALISRRNVVVFGSGISLAIHNSIHQA